MPKALDGLKSLPAGAETLKVSKDAVPPALQKSTRLQLLLSTTAIATALGALVALAWRITMQGDVAHWWLPFAFCAGVLTADFLSGVIHWAADTWGRDDLPFIGRRVLVPFRVHHINPDDFLDRRFLDTNGDVAAIAVPMLALLLAMPLDGQWGSALATFGVGLCGVGMLTNQIHQWAHMAAPPPVVRVLQRARLLLGRQSHAVHHARPYDARYCITTGWCNAVLDAIGFFRRLERIVTQLTGMPPREDDDRYEDRYATVVARSTHGDV